MGQLIFTFLSYDGDDDASRIRKVSPVQFPRERNKYILEKSLTIKKKPYQLTTSVFSNPIKMTTGHLQNGRHL